MLWKNMHLFCSRHCLNGISKCFRCYVIVTEIKSGSGFVITETALECVIWFRAVTQLGVEQGGSISAMVFGNQL